MPKAKPKAKAAAKAAQPVAEPVPAAAPPIDPNLPPQRPPDPLPPGEPAADAGLVWVRVKGQTIGTPNGPAHPGSRVQIDARLARALGGNYVEVLSIEPADE